MGKKIVVTKVNTFEDLRIVYIDMEILKNWILKTADYVIRVCDVFFEHGELPRANIFNSRLHSEGELVVELYGWAELILDIVKDRSPFVVSFPREDKKHLALALERFEEFQITIQKEDDKMKTKRYEFFPSFYEPRSWTNHNHLFLAENKIPVQK